MASVLVSRLLMALEPFFVYSQTLPLRCVQAFLLVAEHPGESVMDYARRAGMTHSSMSRNIADLGRGRLDRTGYGLLSYRENPSNRSHKQIFLTQSGEALLFKMTARLKHGEVRKDDRNGKDEVREAVR